MRMTSRWLVAAAIAASLGFGSPRGLAQEPGPADPYRCVLLELFTSQGCNLCPEAEQLLGSLADRNRRIVPIAFHVDYFNTPWPDPYSAKLHSERQMGYHNVYPKPKPPQYGLYYTPMLMIDGAHSVNGRDRAAAEAAIRLELQRPPAVGLRAALAFKGPLLTGELQVRVAPRSPLAEGRSLLIGAVLRDDGLTNQVTAGENADKTLVARFPARKTLFENLTLEGTREKTVQFTFELDAGWATNRLRVAVFAQDQQSGLIHQALDLPWKSVAPGGRPLPDASNRLETNAR